MRRSHRSSTAQSCMAEGLRASGNISCKGSCRRSILNRPSQHALLPIDRCKSISDETLNEKLSSALSARDEEFARILHDVDEISKNVKLGTPDLRTLSNALR